MRMPKLALPAILLFFFIGSAFLWPALKLYTMSDRERLKKTSLLAICGMTMLAAVFMAALYLNFGLFLNMSQAEDSQLKKLAGMIHSHLLHREDIRIAIQATLSSAAVFVQNRLATHPIAENFQR